MRKVILLAALLLACTAACSAPGPVPREETALPPASREVQTPLPEASREPLPEEIVPEVPAEEKPAPPEERRAAYLRVRVEGLNVRTGAGTEYAVLGQAQEGMLLPLYEGCGGWYETRYRGKSAYVSEKYVEILQMPCGAEGVEAVIWEGCRLLGMPYVYGAVRLHDGRGNLLGGFSETALDCSSLMQCIFYRGAGVLLDVTTRTQIKQGIHVRREEVRRGDLMFFTNASRYDRSGIERVGHVALYLGDGYILHTASDFAKIEKLSQRREAYFLEARRVL